MSAPNCSRCADTGWQHRPNWKPSASWRPGPAKGSAISRFCPRGCKPDQFRLLSIRRQGGNA